MVDIELSADIDLKDSVYQRNFGKWFGDSRRAFSWRLVYWFLLVIFLIVGANYVYYFVGFMIGIEKIMEQPFYRMIGYFLGAFNLVTAGIALNLLFPKLVSVNRLNPSVITSTNPSLTARTSLLDYEYIYKVQLTHLRVAYLLFFAFSVLFAFYLIKPMPLIHLLLGNYHMVSQKALDDGIAITALSKYMLLIFWVIEYAVKWYVYLEIFILLPFVYWFARYRIAFLISCIIVGYLSLTIDKWIGLLDYKYNFIYLVLFWISLLIARDVKLFKAKKVAKNG